MVYLQVKRRNDPGRVVNSLIPATKRQREVELSCRSVWSPWGVPNQPRPYFVERKGKERGEGRGRRKGWRKGGGREGEREREREGSCI